MGPLSVLDRIAVTFETRFGRRPGANGVGKVLQRAGRIRRFRMFWVIGSFDLSRARAGLDNAKNEWATLLSFGNSCSHWFTFCRKCLGCESGRVGL
jgi:hypothetical protein